ncbi:hypothetical protein CALCODRAFT_521067 [Calocera cornea HHB12733]|uniref:WW domain-containing protein n=1 Tax=Calocera cornea HHB12733 TaxID=1353952 RepID=A0A165D1S3_9BASI|nr:hypothetical protein CALCODRAFT_521067 [Calocera cornea HHB12733]
MSGPGASHAPYGPSLLPPPPPPPTGFATTSPPPLPAGWTEHLTPAGVPYYHHALSQHSTYLRPENPHAPAHANGKPKSNSSKPRKPKPKPKPEKPERPVSKQKVPGSGWWRVRTSRGNVFFRDGVRGVSVWEVPEEVADAVAALEREEREEHESLKRRARAAEIAEGGEWKSVQMDVEHAADDGPEERDEDLEHEAREAAERWKAEEAAAEAARRVEQAQALREAQERAAAEEAAAALPLPELAPEEARVRFRQMLDELNVSPLMPAEDALALLAADARYTVLKGAAERLEVWNEYCRAAASARAAAAASGSAAPKLSAEDEFLNLLHSDVTSTRTSWTDWRRKWKKERRFWGWAGDREREARFRQWLRVLGERKRGEREAAERRFGEMLAEASVDASRPWAEVKKQLASDPRYDAVGSASLREELYTAHVASLRAASSAPQAKHASKLERQQRALHERQAHVGQELARAERQAEHSRSLLGAEEGERDFGSLLVDAVRDLDARWEDALRTLRPDPRFARSRLAPARQKAMFDEHLGALRRRQVHALEALFAAHAPALNTPFSDLPLTLVTSLPATKLGLTPRTLEAEYERWQARRRTDARREFDEMLRENSFVTFWARARKLAQRAEGEGDGGLGQGVQLEETAAYGDEEEFVSEEADALGGLAKRAAEVGLNEVAKVLQGDRRWRAWDWMGAEREAWVREWMEGLKAPGRSVHTAEA